ERAADGRAVLGARPDLDRSGRGDDRGAPRVGDGRHRHTQHAAGASSLGPLRLLPRGRERTRPNRRAGADREDVLRPRRPEDARVRAGAVRMRHARRGVPVLVGLVVALAIGALGGGRAVAAPAAINGSGSTYVGLAMQQWVADAQTSGLSVNYLPTGSPDGLTSFSAGLTDFAGTEAEFSALSGGGGNVGGRGFQYVPDVAGAVAIMYNVD